MSFRKHLLLASALVALGGVASFVARAQDAAPAAATAQTVTNAATAPATGTPPDAPKAFSLNNTCPVKPLPPDTAPELVTLFGNRQPEFNRIDQNCDGFLTNDELQQYVDATFDAADANHDGSLSADESAAIVNMFQAAAENNPDVIADKRAQTLQNRLAVVDADQNGIITKQEWETYWLGRYRAFDKNGDGKIDITEFQSDDEQRRGIRRPNP